GPGGALPLREDVRVLAQVRRRHRPRHQRLLRLLLPHDRLPRDPRPRRRDPAALVRLLREADGSAPLRDRRKPGALLALRRPGLDLPVPDRLPALKEEICPTPLRTTPTTTARCTSTSSSRWRC